MSTETTNSAPPPAQELSPIEKARQIQAAYAKLQADGIDKLIDAVEKAEADLKTANDALAKALGQKPATSTGDKPKRVNLTEAYKVEKLNPVLTGEPKSLKQIQDETGMTPTQFKPVLEAQKKKLEITEDPKSTRAAGKKAKMYRLKPNQTLTVAPVKK